MLQLPWLLYNLQTVLNLPLKKHALCVLDWSLFQTPKSGSRCESSYNNSFCPEEIRYKWSNGTNLSTKYANVISEITRFKIRYSNRIIYLCGIHNICIRYSIVYYLFWTRLCVSILTPWLRLLAFVTWSLFLLFTSLQLGPITSYIRTRTEHHKWLSGHVMCLCCDIKLLKLLGSLL